MAPAEHRFAMNGWWKFRKQIFATAIVTIGSFGTGTVFGWSSVATDDILQRGEFPDIGKDQISWVTSVAILGAFAAGPLAGYLMDRLGRKIALLIFTLPSILGWTIMSSAYYAQPDGFFLLYIGRILTGIGGGSCLVIVPTYINGIAADHLRGILGGSMTLTLVTGILFTFVIGSYCHWALMTACCGVIPMLLAIGCCFIPDSPIYWLFKHQKKKAFESYRWLNREASDDEVNKMLDTYSAEMHQEDDQNPTKTHNWRCLRNLFTKRVGLPILLVFGVFFFQQFGGCNIVTMYTTDLFRETDGSLDPHTATILLGVVQIVSVAISMMIIDTLGRKTLLIFTQSIMGCSLICLAVYFHIKDDGVDRGQIFRLSPIIAVYLYVAAYACGPGSVAWVLASEIFNPDHRAESASIATSSYWIFGFAVAVSYESIKGTLEISGSFFFYAACCLGGAIFAAAFVPETKGKSTAEIMKYFDNKGVEKEPSGIMNSDYQSSYGEGDSSATAPMLTAVNEQMDFNIQRSINNLTTEVEMEVSLG